MSQTTHVAPSSNPNPGTGSLSAVWVAVVVAALVGVFGSLYLLAAAQGTRRLHRLQSVNNMRQIGLALFNYQSVYNKLPAHAAYSFDGKPLLSWRVQILPYLEETNLPGLHKEFHMDEPWDSPHNRALIARMPTVFSNPDLDAEPGKTNYLGVVGEKCALDGTAIGITRDELPTDAHTIVFVEADEAVPWTKPDDLEFDAVNTSAGLGKFRGDVWLAARATGQVDEIPAQTPLPASRRGVRATAGRRRDHRRAVI